MLRKMKNWTNKYKNISCKCQKGHIHKSIFEANVCNDLHLEYRKEIKSGKVEIKIEVKFSMDIGKIHITNHYMDFIIEINGIMKKAIEAKGFPTPVWRIKKKLFEALYPNIEYEIRYYK